MLVQVSFLFFILKVPIQLIGFGFHLFDALQNLLIQIYDGTRQNHKIRHLFHSLHAHSRDRRLNSTRTIHIFAWSVMLQIIKIVIIALTLHRIPILCKILSDSLFISREKIKFSREINEQFTKSIEDFIRIFSGVLIVSALSRIKSVVQRLRKYNRHCQLRKDELERKHKTIKESNSLDNLSWITYGKICQYLSVQDLATLSQVSTKFCDLNMKEHYWEYQFNRDWSNYNGSNPNQTFKEKCINAFKQTHPHIDSNRLQERQDKLFGSVYIVFDEAVNSLKAVPYLVLVPVNVLSYLLLKMFKPARSNEHYLYLRNNHFVDAARHDIVPAIMRRNMFKVLIPSRKNFSALYLDLVRWILIAGFKYVCEVGHLLGYIGYFIIKKTSAGDFNEIEIQVDGETGDLTVVRGVIGENEEQNVFKRYILYWLQLILSCGYFYLLLTVFISLPTILIEYFNWEWHTALVGPCFVCLVHYFAILNSLVSVMNVISQSAPFFKPWRAITMTCELLKFILLSFNKN